MCICMSFVGLFQADHILQYIHLGLVLLNVVNAGTEDCAACVLEASLFTVRRKWLAGEPCHIPVGNWGYAIVTLVYVVVEDLRRVAGRYIFFYILEYVT